MDGQEPTRQSKRLLRYRTDSQQYIGNGMELNAWLNAQNGVAVKNHLGVPDGSATLQALPSSPIAHDMLRAPTDSVPQPRMSIPSCKQITEHMRLALKLAMPKPPVTTTSLQELDLTWIIHNIHLRSDINFESDLHFMPVKGKRAEQKHMEAQEYWLALAAELQIHLHTRLLCLPADPKKRDCNLESFEPRLPQMFADLLELLKTLVPDRDHVSVADNLDVPFLMQQIENGVLDICELARWLTTLLKSHCAPVRDEWADQMTHQIEEGARSSDMILLVRGVERLFSVLEAMKLVMLPTSFLWERPDRAQDVANHQIRTLRYSLIENTISFQRIFFLNRIRDGKLNTSSCRDWYHEARRRQTLWKFASSPSANLDGYPSLIQGIVTTLLGMGPSCVMPDCFEFDLKRLELIGSDMQDLVHLKIATFVFDELRLGLMSGQANNVPQEGFAELQLRILAIVDKKADSNDPWQTSSADVALEVTRAAYMFCGSSEVLVPDFVIQHAHFRLNQLRSARTPECAVLKDVLHRELTIKAIHYAQAFNDKTLLEMSEAQQQWRQQRERNTRLNALPEIEDVARSVAHFGIIHWKIWANLVYLDDADVTSPGLPSALSPSPDPFAEGRTALTPALSSSVGMAVD